MPDMLAIACSYIRNGWAPVPVPYRQKGPVIKEWPELRLNEQTAPKYFANGPVNIGVILGPPSGGLADIDLDCAEALVVAAAVLPPTLRFGRPSTRAAHWIYRTSFPAGTKAAITFDDPAKLRVDPKAARLLELRTGAGDRAAQTVFPGSVHESGELITWEDDGSAAPATIPADELTTHATRVAALSLLARYWPPKGNRHDLSLAIGGMLARGGWDDAAIKNFVGIVVHGANDPRPGDRVRCALDAAANVADAQPAYGFPKLKELLGDTVAGKLAEWLGCGAGSAAQDGPTIRCGATMTPVAEAGERAIAGARLPVYRRDTLLVRPVVLKERDAYGRTVHTVGLSPISTIAMRGFLDQAARFEKYDSRAKAWVHCKPPADIAELILARAGHWPFPSLRGVLAAPSLRLDGSLLDRPGYDADTGMYVIEPPPMSDIPDRPTWADGQQAMETLDRLLESFPWQGDDDARAVGLSALITPVVRAALPTAPLHAISAPEAGTGKSYLTQIAAAIATGAPCPVISTGRNEEETEKRLAALVLSGLTVASIDNVSQPLGGDFLCQLLDQPRLKIRILGQTGGPTLEPRITLFATGNNLTLLGDVVRRAVIARMDAACAEPWDRQFQVDPLAQVMADRGRYIGAALTAVRAFLLSGEPTQPPLASFTTWSNWVRSAIVAFGYGDPVRTVATAVVDDPDRQALGALLAAWWAAFGGSKISVATIIKQASERDATGAYTSTDLRDAVMTVAAGKGGDINSSRLGRWLRRHKDRRLNDLVLRQSWDRATNTSRWVVAQC
jgi:hypothetical protein